MKRRTLIHWVGAATLAASLPTAIAACTPPAKQSNGKQKKSSENGTTSDRNFVSIGSLTDLEQQGYLINEASFATPIIVIKDPNKTNALIALSAKCTHSGCDVAWQEDLFACPCHGSKFNPDGSVVNGPATQPLAPYVAKIEGTDILAAASS